MCHDAHSTNRDRCKKTQRRELRSWVVRDDPAANSPKNERKHAHQHNRTKNGMQHSTMKSQKSGRTTQITQKIQISRNA